MVAPRSRARLVVLGCVLAVLIIAAPAGAAERLVFDALIGATLPNPFGGTVPAPDYVVPSSMAIDGQGTVYVADPRNNRVLKYDFVASTPTILTTLASGAGLSATLSFPVGVAVDPRNDDVWIANTGAFQLVKIDKTGRLLTVAGSRGVQGATAFGQFQGPVFVAVDGAGNVYVTDDGGVLALNMRDPSAIRVQKFRSNGTFVTAWGSSCQMLTPDPGCNMFAQGAGAPGDGQFAQPGGIAVDSAANVYVADSVNHRVQKFDTNGVFLTKWGGMGGGDGAFRRPRSVAVDSANNVYVADSGNDRIQKFNATGVFLSKEGSPMPSPAVAPGFGSFFNPSAVATAPAQSVGLCILFGGQRCRKVLIGEATTTPRVLQMDVRDDADADGLLPEVDFQPAAASVDFGNGHTLGRIRVDSPDLALSAPTPQTASPRPLARPEVEPDTIRLTTGFATPAGSPPQFDWLCASSTLTLLSNTTAQIHCSTPALSVLGGQAELTFVAADGTPALAVLEEGDAVLLHQDTSAVEVTAGSPTVTIRGASVVLTPGQQAFADATAPTTGTWSWPWADPFGWHNSDVTVTLSASDNSGGSGVRDVSYALGGAQSGAGTVSGTSASVAITADGITTLTYFARDHAGNQEAARTLTVRIDRSCATTPDPDLFLTWPAKDPSLATIVIPREEVVTKVRPCGSVLQKEWSRPIRWP